MVGTSGWPGKEKVLGNCDLCKCKCGDGCLYCECAMCGAFLCVSHYVLNVFVVF